jgi:hypothetical protein
MTQHVSTGNAAANTARVSNDQRLHAHPCIHTRIRADCRTLGGDGVGTGAPRGRGRAGGGGGGGGHIDRPIQRVRKPKITR